MSVSRVLFLVGLLCVALLPAYDVEAQGRDTPAVENTKPPKASPPAKNVPPGKEHASAQELYGVCLDDLNKCNEKAFALGQQIKELQAENAKLTKAASAPVCHDRHVWKHPTIADVNCHPYACKPNAFACVKSCNNQLECAPGRRCKADGVCDVPPTPK
jgi:hypothetical protein